MGTVTAKQLKQKTGELLQRVKSGEHLTITYRGKPVAVMTPAGKDRMPELHDMKPFDEAWVDIEKTLGKTKPAFKGWKEATHWVRK